MTRILSREGKYRLFVYKDGQISQNVRKELEALGVGILEGFTLKNLYHLLSSGLVILSHSPRDAHLTKRCPGRKVVNLWHGVAIKKIELLMEEVDSAKQRLLEQNSKLYDLLIASSEKDRQTNARAFGVPLEKVRVTGLPRYDFLKKAENEGPLLAEEEKRILEIKGSRRLILFAPTFREKTRSFFLQFTEDEWEILARFAEERDLLIGLRPHPYDLTHIPKNILSRKEFALFNSFDFTEPNLLLRNSDLLVVDFTSLWVDYLLLKRPILGFAKDFRHYLERERGFVYPFEEVFPSDFHSKLDTLLNQMDQVLEKFEVSEKYKKALELFHAYPLDSFFAVRVLREIERLEGE